MSCEHLVCAQCAGPVVEGRCQACKTTRAHIHRSQPNFGLPLLLIALVVTLLVILALRLH